MVRYRNFVLVAVALAMVVLSAGCQSDDGSGSARPATTTAASTPTTFATASTAPGGKRTPVAGFGEIAYRVQGSSAQRCALLAETGAQQARGLMNRTDLAGYDGMLFVFATDTTGQFYMKDTLMPLSIAWFDASGRFVSSRDMEPCLDKPANECPLYSAMGPYRYALEVQKGGLGGLQIGPGSVLTPGGACT